MVSLQQLTTEINAHLSQFIERSIIAFGELTIEVVPDALRTVCFILRDHAVFDFKQLIDVCGVDYLQYGLSEWPTESTTATGFERGVDQTHFPGPKKVTHASLNMSIKAETLAIPTTKETLTDYSAIGAFKSEASVPAEPRPLKPDNALGTPPDPLTDPPSSNPFRFASVYHLLSLTHNMRIRIKVHLKESNLKVPSVADIWPAANWFEREAFDLFGIFYIDHPDLRRILTDYGFVGHPFRKDFPLIGHVEARYDAKLKRVIYEPVSISPRVLEPKVIRRDNRYQAGE